MLAQLLTDLVAGSVGDFPSQLAALIQLSPSPNQVFAMTPDNLESVIKERLPIFQAVYPQVLALPSSTHPGETLVSLWDFWLPLALQLVSWRQQLARPLVQGILGGQGTGKTTLAAVLSLILPHFGYRTLAFSLDDLYKTYDERQRLQQQDPRLIWRGPPGTHDVVLGMQVLDQLRQADLKDAVLVPRFDKSAYGGIGDRIAPESVTNIDVVLFEGWFVGVRPLPTAVFDAPMPAPINSLSDRLFARELNDKLQDYLPLWERLDRLLILYPVDYRFSQQWRRQAEQQMIKTGKAGMTDAQVDAFVEYFWRSLHPELFITPLTKNPNLVDLVVEIHHDHSIGHIYQPGTI